MLEESPINITMVKAIKDMYKGITSRIKIGKKLTPQFMVTKGLRQGCSMSPVLFNIYLEKALLQWRRKCKCMGVPINDRTIYTLHYADDQVVLAQDVEDIEYMTRKLFEEYEKWGLEVNLKKSEYMCVGGTTSDLLLNNGKTLKACEQYKYLGSDIEKDGQCDGMISSRIVEAKKITGALNSILWQGDISIKTKTVMYDALVKPTLTYTAEVWQVSKRS